MAATKQSLTYNIYPLQGGISCKHHGWVQLRDIDARASCLRLTKSTAKYFRTIMTRGNGGCLAAASIPRPPAGSPTTLKLLPTPLTVHSYYYPKLTSSDPAVTSTTDMQVVRPAEPWSPILRRCPPFQTKTSLVSGSNVSHHGFLDRLDADAWWELISVSFNPEFNSAAISQRRGIYRARVQRAVGYSAR